MLEILPFMDKVDLWKHPHFKAAAPARKCLGLWCPACMLGGCLTCLSHSCLVRGVAWRGVRITLASRAKLNLNRPIHPSTYTYTNTNQPTPHHQRR